MVKDRRVRERIAKERIVPDIIARDRIVRYMIARDRIAGGKNTFLSQLVLDRDKTVRTGRVRKSIEVEM